MEEKRYTSTTVRDKKNLQRTLNTFSEQFKYIAMEILDEPAYQFYFFDNLAAFESEYIVFDKTLAGSDLTDTNKLLEANLGMFEHKLYQAPIEMAIRKLHGLGKLDDKVVTANAFFTKEKETVLSFLHNEIEQTIEKTLSGRFVSKLYSTLRNRVLYPFLYSSDYLASKDYKIKLFDNSIETTIRQHYNLYNEHKWILESKEDFQLYHWQMEEEPNNPIVQEWNQFMGFLFSNKIEKRLLENITFLGAFIDIFIAEIAENEYPKPILKYLNRYKFCFISQNSTLHSMKLRRYLEFIEHQDAYNYRQIGKIHLAITKLIPDEIQYELHSLYEAIRDNKYKSVFDFSNPSRQTFTPSQYDEYYYARYGYYPKRDKNEADEQSEEEDEDESDEPDSGPKTYFPHDNTTSDEFPFGDLEEEKIETPSKKPDNVPPSVDYGDDKIPF